MDILNGLKVKNNMEKSCIKLMNKKYLDKIGIKSIQISKIEELVKRVINEKLYTKTLVPYHNIKHIEKVLIYSYLILNKKKLNGEKVNNEEILLYAALYHDCGRRYALSKNHGIVGAKIAREKLKDTFDEKTINSICLLIETHAIVEDEVNFKDYDYTKEEKNNIQILSNILKDSDALDRNRIKLFKFAQCNPKFLRTKEAKEIYKISDSVFNEYINTKKYKEHL